MNIKKIEHGVSNSIWKKGWTPQGSSEKRCATVRDCPIRSYIVNALYVLCRFIVDDSLLDSSAKSSSSNKSSSDSSGKSNVKSSSADGDGPEKVDEVPKASKSSSSSSDWVSA